MFKSFILELIREIKQQILTRVTSTPWNQVKEMFTGSASELFENLDEFVEELRGDQYLDITGQIQASKQDEDIHKEKANIAADASASLSENPSMQVKVLAELFSELERKRSQNYSQVFIRVFNIRKLIARLREILTTLNVKHLYVFIDDFSELPRSDMEQVVDTILAPLNNWSDEFIKLKIAVYPGRLYASRLHLRNLIRTASLADVVEKLDVWMILMAIASYLARGDLLEVPSSRCRSLKPSSSRDGRLRKDWGMKPCCRPSRRWLTD